MLPLKIKKNGNIWLMKILEKLEFMLIFFHMKLTQITKNFKMNFKVGKIGNYQV